MGFVKRKRPETPGTSSAGVPEGLWTKCSACNQTLFRNEVEEHLQVCPACGFHFRLGAAERIRYLTDAGSFQETHAQLRTADPLQFRVGKETYAERVRRAQEDTGLSEALTTGFAAMEGVPVALGVMDARFMMASMGSVVGEKFGRLADDAITRRIPLILFAASGGARMQEGILGLMQMAKTADAVRRMNEAGVPYIVVLTDPTSGGVWASLASLGDIVLAEPGAYIGFAGTRLIEGALKIKVPKGFQRAEYQFENGFVDRIVRRQDMKALLARLALYLRPGSKGGSSLTPAGV